MHSPNMPFIFTTFDVFQFDISGNDINEKLLENIKLILVKLCVFNFDILGNYFKFLHASNK